MFKYHFLKCKYGYASSAYEMLNQVMERTGTNEKGTISAFYSVLSEEGFEDSITNTVQGLTDGHIILSREKAQKGDYPAINILKPVSPESKIINATELLRQIKWF